MPTMIRAQAGRIVPIRFTVRRIRNDATTGRRERVNGCNLTIIKPDGSTIASPPTPVLERKGAFIAYWNTTGLPAGDYEVQARFGVGFDTVTGTAQNIIQRSVIMRLVTTL